MNNVHFDHIDFDLCEIALSAYIRSLRDKWTQLDRLYADWSYECTCFARLMHHGGRLDDAGLKQAYDEIDARLEKYDDSPSVFCRRDLLDLLRGLARRLRDAARTDRERRGEAHRVA